METNGKDINQIITQARNTLIKMSSDIRSMFDGEIQNMDEMQLILSKKNSNTIQLSQLDDVKTEGEVFEFTRKEG